MNIRYVSKESPFIRMKASLLEKHLIVSKVDTSHFLMVYANTLESQKCE